MVIKRKRGCRIKRQIRIKNKRSNATRQLNAYCFCGIIILTENPTKARKLYYDCK